MNCVLIGWLEKDDAIKITKMTDEKGYKQRATSDWWDDNLDGEVFGDLDKGKPKKKQQSEVSVMIKSSYIFFQNKTISLLLSFFYIFFFQWDDAPKAKQESSFYSSGKDKVRSYFCNKILSVFAEFNVVEHRLYS